jgi:hypothetical protein
VPQLEPIEYIRGAVSQNSRYEIDQKLLRDGYDPAEIDLAWQHFEASFHRGKRHNIFKRVFQDVISNARFLRAFFFYPFALIMIFNILGLFGVRIGGRTTFLFIEEGSALLLSLFVRKYDSLIARGLLYSVFVPLTIFLLFIMGGSLLGRPYF